MKHIAVQGIKSILFDLGSTLWDHQPKPVIQQYKQEAESSALAVVRALLIAQAAEATEQDAVADTAVEWIRALRMEVSHGEVATKAVNPFYEPDFPALYRDALRARGIQSADLRWGALLYEAFRMRSADGRVLFPDALPTLATLRDRGYTLGLVTNRSYGGQIFLDDLRQMGLLEFFELDRIAVSADLRFRKPHPMIFRYALAGTGTAPNETAMVGNNLRADILGARQLGIFSVWKRENGDSEEPTAANHPDMTITDLAELIDIFL
jgi:HAD superfamily hydrolase (TIGR01549 family)